MTYKSLPRFILFFSIVLCAGSLCRAQPAGYVCDWTAFNANAASLRAAQQAALGLQVPQDDTEVPPEAIKQIQEFKNDLYAALQNYFACQTLPVSNPKILESELYKRFGIPLPQPPTNQPVDAAAGPQPLSGLYLSDVKFQVRTPADKRNLVAVLTTFGIPYGEDAELDIFAPNQAGHWAPVVNFTSTPYKSIAGGFLGFDYKISPPDEHGKWFVVATHSNPWPSSCWQSLFIDAMTAEDLGMLYGLFHDEQYGYVCDDVPPYLRKVSAHGFQVRFSIRSMDESQLSSVSLMNYKVNGDEVTRVQPVALDAENFADEWTRRPWQEAQSWSSPAHLALLRSQHEKLHSNSFGDFLSSRSCSTSDLYQVEWQAEDVRHQPIFFLMRHRGDIFEMLSVSTHPTADCRGPEQHRPA